MPPPSSRRTPRQRAAFAAQFCEHAAKLFAEAAKQEDLDMSGLQHAWSKAFSAFPAGDMEPMLSGLRRVLFDLKQERREAEGRGAGEVMPEEFLRAIESSDQALPEHGGMVSSSVMQSRLKLSRQALSQAVAARRLFVVGGPHGRNYYPAFYAEAQYPRRDLEAVCQALGALPGHLKWEFFVTPKPVLDGKTPLQAIAAGELTAVLRAAAGFSHR